MSAVFQSQTSKALEAVSSNAKHKARQQKLNTMTTDFENQWQLDFTSLEALASTSNAVIE